MVRVFSQSETAQILPVASLVADLEANVGLPINVPERVHYGVSVAGEADRTLITMPAWDSGGQVGVKIVNVVPHNALKGKPTISAVYVVCDSQTGAPIALLDGAELTARRTAAVAALAGSKLSKVDPETHLIVGAGAVARHFAAAYSGVRDFKHTLVWARDPDKAKKLSEKLEQTGFSATAMTSLEQACREADVISCATMAAEPIILGAWLKPDVHVDLMGAYLPHMREADDATLQNALIYVDSLPGALVDAGELKIPLESGVIGRHDIQGDLRDLCKATVHRKLPRKTVFKSVGNARFDFICANAALQRANQRG